MTTRIKRACIRWSDLTNVNEDLLLSGGIVYSLVVEDGACRLAAWKLPIHTDARLLTTFIERCHDDYPTGNGETTAEAAPASEGAVLREGGGTIPPPVLKRSADRT